MNPRPDVARLRAISDEARRLKAEGQWDRAAFERLLVQAEAAAHGYGEALNFLLWLAEPAWIEGMVASDPEDLVRTKDIHLDPTAERVTPAKSAPRRSSASG